jgi:8-oxo-dGTP diphosphatase
VIELKQEMIRNQQGLTETEFLRRYDAAKYERPSVTADILVFTVMDEAATNYRKLPSKVLKLLLVKRGNHPYLGQWALPGGFVANNESIDEAARRELREETNVDRVYLEQLYTWGEVGRDPRARVISCSYLALVDSAALVIRAGDDAADAQWFQVNYRVIQEQKTMSTRGRVIEKLVTLVLASDCETLTATVKIVEAIEDRVLRVSREVVESRGIAFDHAKMIEYAIGRLRNKLDYTDIAFNLMPKLFTLSALQQVYEVILGKELLAAAFRRKVARMVLPTRKFTQDAGHRPSKLYRYNPGWRD